MSLFFGLLMFICIVPVVLIMFFQMYPKNWKEKKLVLGVKNRDEFKNGPVAEEVEKTVNSRRTQAGIIVIATCVISVLLLLLKGMIMQTTVWTIFIFIALILLEVPYVLGNREMKELKRKLGLSGETGVTYVDLSTAGSVHALNPVSVWVPTLVGLIPVVIALLADLKIFLPGKADNAGSFLMTATLGMFWLTSVLMLAFAFVADNMKNEVISRDSTVNVNYNRAKKKIFADLFVIFLWVNAALIAGWLLAFLFFYNNVTILVSVTVYMLVIFAAIALFVRKSKMIEAHYEKEMTLLPDDDDRWLLGLIYYNPKDSRLNVEKRVGVGMSVNAGHPVGKIIYGFAGLMLAFVVVTFVWLGMTETLPMSVKVSDGSVVCHHIKDDYVIKIADIKNVEMHDDLDKLKLVRTFGVGTAEIGKGTFAVDGKNGCTVFLYLQTKKYIKIVTEKKTYYINGVSPEETETAFNEIVRIMTVK